MLKDLIILVKFIEMCFNAHHSTEKGVLFEQCTNLFSYKNTYRTLFL